MGKSGAKGTTAKGIPKWGAGLWCQLTIAPARLRQLLAGLLLCICLPSWALAAAPQFSPCPDGATTAVLTGTACARVTVRLSPGRRDDGDTIELFVRKFPGSGRSRGSLWLIAGGPGESGAALYSFIPELRRLFSGYDIVVPDHRGTGFSTRLCPAEESVESESGAALAGQEWATCYQRLAAGPDRARAFSIDNAADDLAQLIAADRHRHKIIYGVSYGTQLCVRLMKRHRLALSGIILDSLVPTQDNRRFDLSRRSDLVDDIGRRILARCDADEACHAGFGQPAATRYATLLARVAKEPELVSWIPGHDLKLFMGAMLDHPALRAQIPELLNELSNRDVSRGPKILAAQARITAALGDFPQSPASIPLVSIISRSENDLRPDLTAAELDAEDNAHLFRSPLPAYLINPGVPEYLRQRWRGPVPKRAFPVLVLQGDLDSKTAYDGAVAHVERLQKDGQVVLFTVTNAPHFIMFTAPDCFALAVTAFLAGKSAPAARCALNSR